MGWRIEPVFQIQLHIKDLALIEAIRAHLKGVGKIYVKKNSVIFMVRTLNELEVIIEHFDKYCLITEKWADYLLFKEIVTLMQNKEHLTSKGLQKILDIRASINNGITDLIQTNFPKTKAVPRPLVEKIIPHNDWVAGFTSAEGSFMVVIRKNVFSGLKFSICQHSRDKELMRSLVEFFDCGHFYLESTGKVCRFVCYKLSDINDKVIPFFQQHSVVGVKSEDFKDWCKIVGLVKNKALTFETKEDVNAEILQISARINKR